MDKNKEWVRAVAEDMRKELDQSSSQNIINMNIYGAQGQDVNELADIVVDRISTQLVRRKAAFA